MQEAGCRRQDAEVKSIRNVILLKLHSAKHLFISTKHFFAINALPLFYAKMRNYKKYEVWKESHELVIFIYKDIASKFPSDEKYGLTSQMKRAAYSIPLN